MCARGQSRNIAGRNRTGIVFARSSEDALLKVMRYHLGRLQRRDAVYDGKAIQMIC